MSMAVTVYVLCTLTSSLCAVLLIREHIRTRSRLLLWGGLSFTAMAISNALVFLDFVLLPSADLAVYRSGTFLLATALLLYGLVKDSD
jgi:hypothetical protein